MVLPVPQGSGASVREMGIRAGDDMSHRPKRHYRTTSPLAARAIRDLYFVGKLKQHELGRMFGVKQHSVSRIVSGQVWNA